MANQSPAVIAREFANDLTVEQQGSATGAVVGLFEWGPANSPQLISNNVNLVNVFGKPKDEYFVDHMSATNFLSYTNRLFVVRTVPDSDNTPTTEATNSGLGIVDNAGTFEEDASAYTGSESLIRNEEEFESLAATLVTSNTDILFYGRYAGDYGNNISVSMVSSASFAAWTYEGLFDVPLGANEYALIVEVDGEVLETYIGDANPTAVSDSGGSNYIVEKVNRTSRYIYMSEIDLLFADPGVFVPVNIAKTSLSGGDDGVWGATAEDAGRSNGWDLFDDKESIEIDLPFAGGASQIASEYMLENVAAARADCLGFVSPEFDDLVNITNYSTIVTNIVTTRNLYNSNSYAFMDGNYKYQYDVYNDKYRWVPLNGDIAGLHAQSDFDFDAWVAAGGLNRGHIKNTVKLAFSPNKALRDELYKNNINPVVSFPGDGVVLFGNKTMLTSTSSLSRANVRRLLNVLKRSISRMARYQLFEFNDRITRNNFLQSVEPFMRSVQARRGVTKFKVVCDESNNTDQVINNSQFVGDIFIVPNRAIETIFLNFVVAQTGVDFEEITFNGVDL